MKTALEILRLATSYLNEKGIERGRLLAEELLAQTLRCKRLDLYLGFDKPIEEKELTAFREKLKRCAKGEPLQYVLGEVMFYGARIQVDPRVLIPRSETELLVDLIAKKVSSGKVLDLCTGSGCIAIALKKKVPALEMIASDLSKEALQLASHNATINQVDISFLQGDLVEPFLGKKADVVICNPPYIREGEFFSLEPSVRNFEPKIALIGGKRGIEFYERLAKDLPSILAPFAKIFFEIGAGQGEAVKQIFGGKGTIEKDFAGHDRFFFLEIQ